MNDTFSDYAQPIGFQKTSLIDYPGKVAAVIFFPFCNMRCPWCHNGDLIMGGSVNGNGGGRRLVPLGEALLHIERRRSVLGGVTLSGGEPTLYPQLPELIARVKRLGLSVKLDTNGTKPAVLEKLLSLPQTRPDCIAMDLKLSPLRYAALMADPPPAGTEAETARLVERSAALIRKSGIEHEFRSLRLPSPYFTDADMDALRPLALLSHWNFRPLVRDNCLDPAWNAPVIQ
jgi:pyruvate formate lyase activating enzyme